MEKPQHNQKLPKLTKQEKGFVKEVIEHGNATKAVKNSFDIDDSNYAGVKGHELLRNPKIQNAIQEALPDELLARVHLEGLNATIGEDKPDYSVRHRYLDSAYKVKGTYVAQDPDDKPKNTGNTYNFMFSPENQEDIKAFEEKLKARLIQKHVQET